jgi:hypothetical protein
MVQVVHGGEAAYARCRDLSDTGMRLDLTEPLELNECVTVALSPSIVLCGTVAWIDGQEYGVVFDCAVDGEALLEATEPEAPPRRQLTHMLPAMRDMLAGRQAQPRTAPPSRGFVHSPAAIFKPGLVVTVVSGAGDKRALVRWAEGNVAALEIEAAGNEALDQNSPAAAQQD